jgi:hypothetical protein
MRSWHRWSTRNRRDLPPCTRRSVGPPAPPPPPPRCPQSDIPHDWQDPIGAGIVFGAGAGTVVCSGFGLCTLVGGAVGGAVGIIVWHRNYNCQ